MNAGKAGFKIASTDFKSVIKSKSSNTIVIATPHNLHASQVISALIWEACFCGETVGLNNCRNSRNKKNLHKNK